MTRVMQRRLSSFIAGTLLAAGMTSCSIAPAPASGGGTFSIVTALQPENLYTFDWSGRHVGTARLPAAVSNCVAGGHSPDGSRIAFACKDSVLIIDVHGHVVRQLPANHDDIAWTGDDKNMCVVGFDPAVGNRNTLSASLYLIDSDRAAKRVSSVRTGPHLSVQILACDVGHNTALIGYGAMVPGIQAVDRVRLSDGHTLGHFTHCNSLVVSGNSRYGASGGSDGGVVCDLAGGQQVAKLDGEPGAISWNGHVVIEALADPNPPYAAEVQAIDWQSHKVLWTSGTFYRSYPVPQAVSQFQGDALVFVLAGEIWLIDPARSPIRLEGLTPASVI